MNYRTDAMAVPEVTPTVTVDSNMTNIGFEIAVVGVMKYAAQ